MTSTPVFRFAPSPNGHLHLGHALSALLNQQMAKQSAGRFLLRIEDIDTLRCTPELEQAIYDDLDWLGLEWELPVRRQSDHFADYRAALTKLAHAGLVYPAFLTRNDVRKTINNDLSNRDKWPSDPDGTPLYPTNERDMSEDERLNRIVDGANYVWRLNMQKAIAAIATCGEQLFWDDTGAGPTGETGIIPADPARWGDVIIARKDTPTSYHLSVVIDDALQNITHIVRGQDLFHDTSIHRLLQTLLKLPQPHYHHHPLILGPDGQKLSKSRDDTALSALRAHGKTPQDIIKMLYPYI